MCLGLLTHRAATPGRKQLAFFLLSLGLFTNPSMVLAQQAPQVLEIEGLGKARVELEGKWQYHPGRISAEKQMIVANAGHLPPYINGKETAMTGSLPLGLIADATYEQTTLFLADGDTVTLVTDGVIEAQNANKELFGFERLSELLSTQPAAERIVEAACDFGQEDDITVLTIQRLGETVPAAGATLSLITQLA
jgi:hypothetical protein